MKRFLFLILAVLALSGCGYNDFQRLDEQSKAAWSEVLNQYQRRADLVPNIVATVKGEASFEQDMLLDNLAALVDAVNRARPSAAKGQYFKNLTVASTMGPGIRVEVAGLLARAAA